MTGAPVRVFVNERPLEVAPGAAVREAVLQFDGRLAAPLQAGAAYVTDGRGVPLALDAPLAQGSILRVVVSGRPRPDRSVSGG